jgi:hypothetical protein
MLMFNKLTARKADRPLRRRPVHQVTIRGQLVTTVTPEGQQLCMEVGELLKLVVAYSGRSMGTGCLLPDGVKLVRSQGPMTVWVYERPPQVHNLRWIAADSPVPYGKGAVYRTVRIALPYLVVLAVFTTGGNRRLQLSGYNECFFRNGPLKSGDDQLCYPALLNCSKFENQGGRPLSWICTEHLDTRPLARIADEDRRMRESMRALLHCLLETGYNYSSEHHELTSWFSESTGVDLRVTTIEAWEEATAADSLFALDVPWLKTGVSLGQVIDRIFGNANSSAPQLGSATDIMRMMANNSGKTVRE